MFPQIQTFLGFLRLVVSLQECPEQTDLPLGPEAGIAPPGIGVVLQCRFCRSLEHHPVHETPVQFLLCLGAEARLQSIQAQGDVLGDIVVKARGGQIFPHDLHRSVQQLILDGTLLQLGGDLQMEGTPGALLAVVQPVLLPLRKIGKARMKEEPRNPQGVMLKTTHERVNLMKDVLCRIGKVPRMYRELQRMVEVFVGIVFRGIGRQEKHLDFLYVFLQPGLHNPAVMDFQIIQNQEHFPLRCADQALHKLDQPPLIHGVLIDHEAHIALAADRREHIDSFPLCFHWQHRRLTLGSKARSTISQLLTPVSSPQ